MSFFLQVATETADLIEHGEVFEGSSHNYSDFDRLLGMAEARKLKRKELEEKRHQSLNEVEEGRLARAALREQMQMSRHEKLLSDIAREKEEEKKRREEKTLKEKLDAALAKPHQQAASASMVLTKASSSASLLLSTPGSSQDASASAAAAAAAGSGGGGGTDGAAADLTSDPFIRFRAEDERVKRDTQRLVDMRHQYGVAGSDILRRFVEGSDAWEEKNAMTRGIDNESDENSMSKLRDEQEATPNSDKGKKGLLHRSTRSSTSSTTVAAAAAASAKKTPTVARLLMEGYGREQSKQIHADATRANETVRKAFSELQKQDEADMKEWVHRRAFYDRERINVLKQMNTVSQFNSFFTSSSFSASKRDGDQQQNDNGNTATTILGHDPAENEERLVHPIDDYHTAIRGTIAEILEASDPWQVVTGKQRAQVSTLEQANSVQRSHSSLGKKK